MLIYVYFYFAVLFRAVLLHAVRFGHWQQHCDVFVCGDGDQRPVSQMENAIHCDGFGNSWLLNWIGLHYTGKFNECIRCSQPFRIVYFNSNFSVGELGRPVHFKFSRFLRPPIDCICPRNPRGGRSMLDLWYVELLLR